MKECVSVVRAAEPGEIDWVRRKMITVHAKGTLLPQNTEELREALEAIREHEAWRGYHKHIDGPPFESWEDFVQHPAGLDTDLATIATIIGDNAQAMKLLALSATPALAPVGRPRNDCGNENARATRILQSSMISETDTVERTVARLRRDAPELVDEVISGKRSAASARREAGFASKSVRVSLHENPWTAAKSVVSKLGPERARELAERLLSLLDDE